MADANQTSAAGEPVPDSEPPHGATVAIARHTAPRDRTSASLPGGADGAALSWETVVGQNQAAVHRLAYLITGSADEAADVSQEVFIQAWRRRATFDPERALRPWLLAITVNAARNRQRTLARYRAAVVRLMRGQPMPSPAPAPPAPDGPAAEAEGLWRTVGQLPRQQREVILLRYFMELSVAECAAVLAVAEGTVKSRTHRALAALRDQLTQGSAT